MASTTLGVFTVFHQGLGGQRDHTVASGARFAPMGAISKTKAEPESCVHLELHVDVIKALESSGSWAQMSSEPMKMLSRWLQVL